MKKNRPVRCCPTLSHSALSIGAVLAALALPGGTVHAQCSTFNVVQGPPSTSVFAVGQTFQVTFEFGASAHPVGGFMDIHFIDLALDCAGDTACPDCVDESSVLLFAGNVQYIHAPDTGLDRDIMVTHTPPSNLVRFTFVNPGTSTPNPARFDSLTTPETALLQYDLTVNSIGDPPTRKNLISKLQFLGDCNAGTDAFACVSYEVNVVQPDIDIEKFGCPSLVCGQSPEGEPVTYTYEVTTGDGNAPLVGSVVPEHLDSLPAQSTDGTWHRAIEVTDDHCGPGGPNTLLILPGDTNGNGLLDPGENWVTGGDANNNAELDDGETWVYECTRNISAQTTNIATADGEYVSPKGSSPVTDEDEMTVDVVTVNDEPGICGTIFTAKTTANCAESCVWTHNGNFFSDNCTLTLDSEDPSGQYCVTLTCPGGDSNCPGCGQPGQPACPPRSATCCVDFTPPVPPIVEVVGSPACVGGNGELCAIVTRGRAPYSVQWSQGANPIGSPIAVASSGGQACLPIAPTPGVTYTATATDDNGCEGDDDGSVGSFPNRLVTVDDETYCEGDPITPLCATVSGGTPPYTVDWFVCPDDQEVGSPPLFTCVVASQGGECCFTPSAPGSYLARATDANTCQGSDCGTVTEIPLPPCDINNGPTQVCVGDSEQYCGPPGLDSYSWSESSAACNISAPTNTQCVTVNFTGAGNCLLQLTVTDNGCDRTCTERITVSPPPDCLINSGPSPVCIGDTHQYCGPPGMDSYTWSESSATCAITSAKNTQCVSVNFTAAGNCLLLLTIVDNGCPDNCDKRIVVEECGGDEGRTPGFWKQAHHFGHWPAQWCPTASCPCAPATPFCLVGGNGGVFNCAAAPNGCKSAVNAAYAGKTLLQVLQQGGGGFKALGRHAVAGLLNSGVDPNILDYEFSTTDVINKVNTAIATCNPGPAHSDLADANEQEGGNLGGQSHCNDLNLDGSVNTHDLDLLLNNWGRPGIGDIDDNGVVGPADLMLMLSNWGSY